MSKGTLQNIEIFSRAEELTAVRPLHTMKSGDKPSDRSSVEKKYSAVQCSIVQ